MKIKTKKQLNLPQLIEWGFENYVTGAIFSNDRVEAKRIRFEIGILVSIHGDMNKQDTFTVEVEEEITEDTEFKELICLDVDDKYISYDNVCVLDFDKDRVRAIYIPNDDLTMTLIWRDGKLVE
ncbi:hypothetical protein CW747_02465 [Staphylococcus shinii]|uniref:hypothetical protein n=1 Tax=Staphylococcus shinii TaxID=2912228 RepID=UPI000C34A1BB|nr:hypothetical protein [Staphylococcus shinii]PKI11021.1 hypothetical protein CW747_02465 [Staphylococcus shinii]